MGILLIAVISGTLLTYIYDGDASPAERLCTGACTGIAVLAAVGFLLASFFGDLNQSSLFLTGAMGACASLMLLSPRYRAQITSDFETAGSSLRGALSNPERTAILRVLLYVFLVVVLWLVFKRAIFERAGEIYTGVIHNVGDLPFHLKIIASFAYGQNFPPEHPLYAGSRFVYPFLADFATAMWQRAGSSLSDAIFAQNMVLAVSFVGLMRRFTGQLTGNRTAAILGPVLVLFSGGFGWWLIFHDIAASRQGIGGLLMHLPRTYTIMSGTGWRWPNSLTALLLTQRSLLLGLPLAICVLVQWWAAGADRSRSEASSQQTPHLSGRMIAAGLFAGLLPLVHGHTFLIVMAAGAWFAVTSRNWRMWTAFFGAALLLAVPQIWWLTQRSDTSAQRFIGWSFGWDRGDENAFWFWLKNTGVFIPLLIAAIFWRDRTGNYLIPERAWRFYLPFTACFVVPNLVRLAPWVWDNIKVLFYWYVVSVPLVALLLAQLWNSGRLWRWAATVLALAMTGAGGLDVWQVISRSTEYREFDRNGVAFAEWMNKHMEPRARVLHAPLYNSPVFLTGRRSLLGYPGTLWTHGLPYHEREVDIRRIYAGAPEAAALLAQYRIDYVIVGPFECTYTPVNASFFAHYREVGQSGGYRLYSVNSGR